MPKPNQTDHNAPPNFSRSYVALAERTTHALTEIASRQTVNSEDCMLIRTALAALAGLREAEARAQNEDSPYDETDLHALRDQIGCRLDRLRACCDPGEISEEPDDP